MIENNYIRILISEIQEKKKNHELYGTTKTEEYDFYIQHYWNNETYKNYLAKQYVEGDRLEKLKERYKKTLRNEIVQKINIDQIEIHRKFCKSIDRIKELNQGEGDIHKNGQSVSKMEFDDGSILYYKPHSLDKNMKYQKLYKHLCEKAGISCREVKYLSRQTYGWEENIENKSCNTKEEVERYYFRLGIHLSFSSKKTPTSKVGDELRLLLT